MRDARGRTEYTFAYIYVDRYGEDQVQVSTFVGSYEKAKEIADQLKKAGRRGVNFFEK